MHHQYPMLRRYVIPDMPSTDELLPHLRSIDDNRWYSNFGPLVNAFEEKLLTQLSSKNDTIALATVMSCYHALQIGLQLFRLPPEARVLVPAITFPACPLAVRHAGAVPILADIEKATWQLTPQIARAICEKIPIHAVMPVAVYGVPVDVVAWDKFTEDTGIPVIIDAAAAFEVQSVPRHGLVAYSFHATKPFCVGEGGLLVGRDTARIEEARCRSNFGTQQRIVLYDGGNAKMSEYHAAIGLAQMKRWEGIKSRRHKVLGFYKTKLAKMAIDVTFQKGIDRTVASALMLKIAPDSAVNVTNALNARDIMAHRMYLPPLYCHPHFADLDLADQKGQFIKATASSEEKARAMENSEDLHRSVLGMPFHAFLDEQDVDYAVDALAEALS